MDDFLDEKKSLDVLHAELILELTRIKKAQPRDLTFSDADVILYILDLYFQELEQKYSYLMDTPRVQILARLRRNLDDQLKLMENREDPDDNLWVAVINLTNKYLTSQNSHTIA